MFLFVPMAKVGDPAPAGSRAPLSAPSSRHTQLTGSPVAPCTQNAPCKMAGGCSAFLQRGGFAKWKILHT